jgi:phosphotransferase system enzyme I (PtsI)
MENKSLQEKKIQGIAASPGLACGLAYLFFQKTFDVPCYSIAKEQLPEEVLRFEKALVATRVQVSRIRNEVAEKLGEDEATIFDAHLMVLEDKALIDETIKEIETSGNNADWAFDQVIRRFIEAFQKIDDDYIRERITDIKDVSQRVLRNLLGHATAGVSTITEKRILVAEDLSPSDTALINPEQILGLATDYGSQTSHAVIMARSLKIPAVAGLHDFTQLVRTNDLVLLDGYEGVVYLNPTEATLEHYRAVQKKRESIERMFMKVRDLPSQTLDGVSVDLRTNIEGVEDIENVLRSGVAGVGLYRTEFLYLRNAHYPSEEEQFEVYRQVAEQLNPHPVTIRTLDLGGDKILALDGYRQKEENPFLGFRAIRFCLKHPHVFKAQLRAILRASAYGKVRIMYPMISGLDELRLANQMLDECRQELTNEGIAFDPQVPVGSMIEIPSAAYTADILAKECDFFSIGTNDLIQYLIAVDRLNDRIAHLYQPAHPAVLRTIARIVEGAKSAGIKVSVCGEMAGDPVYAGLLLGLGVSELSMTPSAIPPVKYLVRNMRMSDARNMASTVLSMTDPECIFKEIESFHRHCLRGLE